MHTQTRSGGHWRVADVCFELHCILYLFSTVTYQQTFDCFHSGGLKFIDQNRDRNQGCLFWPAICGRLHWPLPPDVRICPHRASSLPADILCARRLMPSHLVNLSKPPELTFYCVLLYVINYRLLTNVSLNERVYLMWQMF